jgi:hypothetical protein
VSATRFLLAAAVIAGTAAGCGSHKPAKTAAEVPTVPYSSVRAGYETWHKTLLDYRAKLAGPDDIDRETDSAFRVAENFNDWRASKDCAGAVRAYSFEIGSYRERLLRGELNDTLAATVIEAGRFMESHCGPRR